MKNLTVFTLIFFLSSTPFAKDEKITFKGDRTGHEMEDPIPKNEIPPAPPLDVKQALASMRVAPGFTIDNIVAEPNVFNPVSMAIDADGRLWVAEMTRYMPNLKGEGEFVPEGNIALLEDTDGDGKIDKRAVFLHDIVLPRTVSVVQGGLFYADHTQLYFVEVIQDGQTLRPGKRDVVDPIYAKAGNLEHKPNGMLYGMDNWYYNAKSADRYKILPHEAPVPAGGKEIYRNKWWKLIKAQTDRRGQWGVTHDDFGRLYHNGNSSPASGEYLLPSVFLKNPEFWPNIEADPIGSTRIFSARMNTGVNRGYLEGTLGLEGKDRGKLLNFTAASGSVIYRGDNFPEKYYGIAITPEPAANLVSARYILENEGKLKGKPVFPQKELLSSTDERFRPVNTYNAPDGSLYILDMYHGILQHKEYLTSYLGKQIRDRDLDKNNNTMGRIYRLRWAADTLGEQPKLSQYKPAELVPVLGHANGWWRDTARRLIVQGQLVETADAIKKLVGSTDDERTIINGLWTLHGLQRLDYPTVSRQLKSPSKHVRATAVSVAGALPEKYHRKLAKTFAKLAKEDYFVALHVALSTGEIESERMFKTSKFVLDTYIDKPYTREAVVSGLGTKSQAFLPLVAEHPDPELQYILHNLGKKPADQSNRGLLSEPGQALYDKGRELYTGKASCFGCHGEDGEGIRGMGPTFWQSQWVIKKPETLAKVLLHGLSGNIRVKNGIWMTTMVMPGYAGNPEISDEDLASIATYIRNTWGNTADTGSHIAPSLFEKVRAETQGRETPYTANDF